MSNTPEVVRAALGLMSNPALQAVFTELETDAIRRWRNTAPEAVAEREQHYAALRALDQLHAKLTQLAQEAAEHA
jgi:hypothetical protein